MMDILQPLPLDEWSLLRDSLKHDWPNYAYYYYFVNNSIKCKRKDPEFKLQIYCPNGDVNAGTFVGISTQSWCKVYVFAFEKSKDLLYRALKETKLINWNELVMFSAVHPDFKLVVDNFIDNESDNKNITLENLSVRHHYFKPKEECLKIQVSVPKECKLRHLNESHIPIIHSFWPHKSKTKPEKSTEFIASMVRLNTGIGLFLKEDDTLVSWILRSDWGGLGMLQTLEEHKRKGYGKTIMKTMMRELAMKENHDSFAFVSNENVASKKLVESLGYKSVALSNFYDIQPKTNCK